MRRSKTWSLVVASVTLVSVLGACSAEDADDGSDGGSTQESSPTTASAGDSETTGESDVTGEGEATATADDEPAAGEDDEVDEEEFQVSAEGATPRDGVAAEIAPDEVEVEGSADEIIAPVVAVQNQALEAPTEVDWDSVVAVADGQLLDTLEASILEYTELGWTQIGAPEVVDSTVLELDEEGDPPTARVEVCLDHDQVDVVDSEGASMIDESAEMRVKSIFTLTFVEGRWVAVAQDFTDDLSC